MSRALAALVLVLAVAAPAVAQGPPRASLPDIEDEVMCVTCNVPLNTAESPQASRQRALIRTEIARGRTKQQIKDRLVEEYGENVLAVPKSDGVGAAAWAVPVATVLVLAGLVALLLPRWRRRAQAAGRLGAAAPFGAASVSEAELRRLDDDLRRLD